MSRHTSMDKPRASLASSCSLSNNSNVSFAIRGHHDLDKRQSCDSIVWNDDDLLTGCSRYRKKLANFLHSHVVLIIICLLAVLDAGCVIGQIIGDILIVKVELHEMEIHTKDTAELLSELIPNVFNSSEHGEITFQKAFTILKTIKEDLLREFQQRTFTASGAPLEIHRQKRDVVFFSGEFGDNEEGHELLHKIAHSFHYGSMAILSVLMFETLLKIFAMGKSILHHKIEVFDAFVVAVSWILDVVFWKGLWVLPGTEAATILVFMLPWRVIRVVNSFVVVIQEKGEVALKIVKTQYKSTLKKLEEFRKKCNIQKIEIRRLRSIGKKRGATEEEIKSCKPRPEKLRRGSSFWRRDSSAIIDIDMDMYNKVGYPSSSDEEAESGNDSGKGASIRENKKDISVPAVDYPEEGPETLNVNNLEQKLG